MFLDINNLGAEGLSFDRALVLHGLEGPSRENIPDVEARLEGTVKPAPGGAALSARLGATVPLTCSRCLDTFAWDVRTDFAWTVLKHAPASTRLGTDADDDASILIAPEGKIGLEDLATEQLYLNLPLKPICNPICKGLCPTCGTNRNATACTCEPEVVDPRLATLLPFRRKIQNS